MFTLHVLPIRTFSVKLSVPALTAPDSTSNETIWRRAGGAMSAIAAAFELLFVGQPFGPGALPARVPFVAAMPAATTTPTATAAMAAATTRLEVALRRYRETRSILPPSLDHRPRHRPWRAPGEEASPPLHERAGSGGSVLLPADARVRARHERRRGTRRGTPPAERDRRRDHVARRDRQHGFDDRAGSQ